MRRRLLMVAAVIAVVVIAFVVHRLAFGGATDEAPHSKPRATSVIGSGDGAVGVSATGKILSRQPPPKDGTVPRLPLEKPPPHGVLSGPMLEQARVLGAAPAVLRPCIEGSYYGESGVDVKLLGGIELYFGDASRAARKWTSAAAILADPTITEFGYVDLHSPGRVSTGGSGHVLPTTEPGGPSTCGE